MFVWSTRKLVIISVIDRFELIWWLCFRIGSSSQYIPACDILPIVRVIESTSCRRYLYLSIILLEVNLLNEQNSASLIPVSVNAGQGAAWLTEAFGLWVKNWIPWTIITLVIIGGNIVINMIPLGGLASQLFLPAILAGLILVCHETATGTPDIADSFTRGFTRNLAQCLILGVVYIGGFLAIVFTVIIFLIISLGGIAVIQGIVSGNTDILAPAIVLHILLALLIALLAYIPLLMATWFAPALIVLENQQAIPAMIVSFRACMANIIPFLVYGLIGLVACVVATIPLLLGWLILMPVFIVSIYTSYRDIFQVRNTRDNQVGMAS